MEPRNERARFEAEYGDVQDVAIRRIFIPFGDVLVLVFKFALAAIIVSIPIGIMGVVIFGIFLSGLSSVLSR